MVVLHIFDEDMYACVTYVRVTENIIDIRKINIKSIKCNI